MNAWSHHVPLTWLIIHSQGTDQKLSWRLHTYIVAGLHTRPWNIAMSVVCFTKHVLQAFFVRWNWHDDKTSMLYLKFPAVTVCGCWRFSMSVVWSKMISSSLKLTQLEGISGMGLLPPPYTAHVFVASPLVSDLAKKNWTLRFLARMHWTEHDGEETTGFEERPCTKAHASSQEFRRRGRSLLSC